MCKDTKQKRVHRLRGTILIGCLALVLGWIACSVAREFVTWAELIYPHFEDLGFQIEIDSPEDGQFVLTNASRQTARDVELTIREDFTYADEGYTSQVVQVGEMTPGERRTFSYRYNSPSGDWDIGRLEIWLRCDRGRAYKIRRWSYASF